MGLLSNQTENFVDILKSKQGFQIIFSPDFRNPPRHFSATPGSGRVGEDVREYSSPVLGRTGPFSATSPPLYLSLLLHLRGGQARQPQHRPARHPPSAQRRPPEIGHRENTETAGSLENRPFALNSLLNTSAFWEPCPPSSPRRVTLSACVSRHPEKAANSARKPQIHCRRKQKRPPGPQPERPSRFYKQS